jgi:hypothetical protein
MPILLYHGSSIGDIHTLQPFTADHGKPYVYFSASDILAALYASRVIEKPYYWVPYGYDSQGRVTYTEVWKDAFADTFSGKTGYLYYCDVDEKKLLRFPSHRNLRLSTEPVAVSRREEIKDLYAWFCQREQEGRFLIQRYNSLTPPQLSLWHGMVLEELMAHFSVSSTENPYVHFVQEKLPAVWEHFLEKAQ